MGTFKYFQIILILSIISFSMNAQSAEYQAPKASKLYKEIVKSNNIELCNQYLSFYPEGKKNEEVRVIKETQTFIKAFSIAAEDYSDSALRNYLNNYPEGSFVGKANDAIEVSAWQKAHNDNTVESYKLYLNVYPNGKAATMAKRKIEEIE